jgi:DNA polymerase III alpha subunit
MSNAIDQSNIVETRSFLIANVDRILENISSRREAKKIDTDDLFGDFSQHNKTKVNWKNDYKKLSKLDILMMEKEILGLYVSGNPLQEYSELQEWVREVTGFDDIYLVVVEKIKKIFTKAGAMMLGMNITILPEEGKEAQIEGVVYSKRTPILSPILEEKKIYWVKGKLSEPKEKAKPAETTEPAEIDDTIVEQREYVEATKLIFDEACRIDQGILPIFESTDYRLSQPRREILQQVNWAKVSLDPSLIFQQDQHQELKINRNYEVKLVTIRDNINIEKVKEIKRNLKQETNLSSDDNYKVVLKVIHNGVTKDIPKDYWIDKGYFESIRNLVSQ